MKAPGQSLFVTFTVTLFLATSATASTQLILQRGESNERSGEVTGLVDLTVRPGFENARVTVSVDGQKVAANLLSPWRVTVDFGPSPVQHRITVTATAPHGRRSQWTETVNRGNLPLSLRVHQLDATTFEAGATSPKDDPIVSVDVWQDAKVVSSMTQPPYRFTASPALLVSGFVQVTATTASGEEAADFWSSERNVVAEEMQVRTIPIFVSVVDSNGNARDDVDRSHFRIIDNEAEAKIVEFGKAFDQPISIALLLDASSSMTYVMANAAKAAKEFVQRALKDGDRCSVTAVQEVPRRKQPLSSDRTAIAKAVTNLQPVGQTALYDAIISAVRELRDEKNRRAMVILTDGGDTSSNYSYDEAAKTAREAGIPMYFIAYEGGQAQDLERLRYLAAETGGFMATATEQNLPSRYASIEKDLRAQFAIKYQISDFGRSNEYRRVRVVLDSPKLTARTIKGYFTP